MGLTPDVIYWIHIKGWPRFQSYKDRRPPWIRLHRTLLDNYEFQAMSANARALLPMLWLLASEDENPVSGSLRIGYERITFRLRMDINDVISGVEECENNGFLTTERKTISDTKPLKYHACSETVTEALRNRYETVTPETETETEKTLCDKHPSHEINISRKRRKPRSVIEYTESFSSFWWAYPRQVGKQVAFEAWKRLLRDGYPDSDLIEAAGRYATARTGEDEKFTLHPATFLNKGRWKDYCFEDDTPKEAL